MIKIWISIQENIYILNSKRNKKAPKNEIPFLTFF